MIIQTLWHFDGFALGDVLNAEDHHGKLIGAYKDEAEAASAVARVQHQPGFRDHPDGFRLFPFDVDRTYWADGFLQGSGAADEAIADDGSGIFGNDSALLDFAGDTDRDMEDEEAFLAAKPQPDRPDQLWDLSHYKISRENDQSFEDMGYKLIGFYTTRRLAEEAIAMLRGKPGFRDHPEGFRLTWITIGNVRWQDGFA
ncbi:hypothetical protein [Falsiroseomonas stagni]|uniref:Uncharacterized protein n=1 Tax=Falsiroseomonas stagni DSM 19981 TaxID=1123062 RepID=A0A1I4B039_9PROT|nr:hypothetical protein [Falsiroseomonas stagni]SFK62125.1 hypothetical protein SAMN02745775_104339 [Falsiroseomonas stagni DSM 19981]